jgi:hypothetical protein
MRQALVSSSCRLAGWSSLVESEASSRGGPRLAVVGISRQRGILIALALLVAVIGISAAVGFAAHGRGFSWAVASVFGTALGTTLLAVATLGLAYSTWQDVRASQQVAEVTGRSLRLAETEREERMRPAVIGTVIAVNMDLPQDDPHVSVRLHNVGGGVAVRVEVTLDFAGEGDSVEFVEPEIFPILLPDDSRRLDLYLQDIQFEGVAPEPEDLRVRGLYRDRLGRVMPPIIDWLHDPLESGI